MPKVIHVTRLIMNEVIVANGVKLGGIFFNFFICMIHIARMRMLYVRYYMTPTPQQESECERVITVETVSNV